MYEKLTLCHTKSKCVYYYYKLVRRCLYCLILKRSIYFQNSSANESDTQKKRWDWEWWASRFQNMTSRLITERPEPSVTMHKTTCIVSDVPDSMQPLINLSLINRPLYFTKGTKRKESFMPNQKQYSSTQNPSQTARERPGIKRSSHSRCWREWTR